MNPNRLLVLAWLISGWVLVQATQAQTKTIVMVRHTEKDTSVANDPDPGLSAEGRERAIRLEKAVRRFKPYEIFSTNTRRTRQTAETVASRRKKDVQTYNASNHQQLIDKILASRRRHFLVVGHSNTIPFLANLLTKKEIFRQLPDAEHGVIYVVRVRKGVFRKLEILSY